ncbi:MAG: ADP/ATP-dependent (S)-NAD(P)H-hydrate dehydratase, partial [Spirochaetota bacterium]
QVPSTKEFFDESGCSYLRRRCRETHFDAVLIGPGLGRHPETISSIWNLLLGLIGEDIPLVLDADALYILSRKSPNRWPQSNGKAMYGITTPHSGELQRWLGATSPGGVWGPPQCRVSPDCGGGNAEKILEGRVILCSGSTDTLYGPGGHFATASGGYPRMACAGTGDLLAGLCASFLAQGMNPWPAARLAAYILRQAGTIAGRKMGIGFVADDLPPFIAQALAQAMV